MTSKLECHLLKTRGWAIAKLQKINPLNKINGNDFISGWFLVITGKKGMIPI